MNGKQIDDAGKRVPRRGVFLLPNLLTTASLFCGFYGLVASVQLDFKRAAFAVCASFLLDGLDGIVARATRTTSRFGIEYDSLADLVAFGVAPAVLVYIWALAPLGRLGWLAAFLYIVCGALRLARFNVQHARTTAGFFNGLPIPWAAGLLVSTFLFSAEVGWAPTPPPLVVLAILYGLSFLMVSGIPYRSYKDAKLLRQKPFHTLVGLVLVLVVILAHPAIMLFLLFLSYTVSGPVRLLWHLRKTPVPKEGAGGVKGL